MSIYVKHVSLYYANIITNRCKICTSYTLFKATHKTKNTETGNEKRGMQGMRVMCTTIPGNVFILVFRGMLEKIPGNI